MNLIVIDIETTGLDPETDRILEIGAAVFNVPERNVIWQIGGLVGMQIDENPTEEMTGITPAMLAEAFDAGWDVLEDIEQASQMFGVTAAVAHAAHFERAFLDGVLVPPGDSPRWICTVSDIRFPNQGGSNKLDHLAVDHGIPPVSVRSRHRALPDVLITCELLATVPDLEHQVTEALKPKKTFIACVSYEEKDLAKAAGFVWDRVVSRAWAREMPFDTPIEPTETRPFPVRPVEKRRP